MIYNYVISFFAYICWLYSYICKKFSEFIASQRPNKKAWTIIGWILLPNLLGWISYVIAQIQLTNNYFTSWDDALFIPAWGPPTWMLHWGPILMYTMMGYASYIVYRDCEGFTVSLVFPLTLYGAQLLLNMSWMPIFIRYYSIGLALYNLIVLTITTLACTACFYHINRKTFYLMVPQVVYSAFLTTYMFCILKLNPYDY